MPNKASLRVSGFIKKNVIMNKLNEEIMSGAKACGICEEWYNMMKEADTDGLLDMYKRGIDFVIKHSFPGNPYLLSHSTDEIRHKHLIFIDETVPEEGGNGTYVFNGACRGKISFDRYSASTLHIRDKSQAAISAKGLSKVFINVYDHSCVDVIQEDAAKVFVYPHGDSCHVRVHEECHGNVHVRKPMSG